MPNLGPTHRRFIAENAAYAVLRGVAGIYLLVSPGLAMPLLLTAVMSHFIEAVTIAWELFAYGAPPDAAPPMTLMGIFSTWTLLTTMNNAEGYITIDEPSLLAMKVFVGLTWFAWLCGVIGIVKNKKKIDSVPMN